MSRINAEKLIALRKAANMTAEALANAARVGRATITRIENRKTSKHNAATVTRLANALKCQPADLATPPEPPQRESFWNDRVPVHLKMSSAAQNAVELMALRYGEDSESILELAPLLFDLFARESLKARKERLEELGVCRAALAAMEVKFSHLAGRQFHDWQAEDVDDLEETSIRKSDLRGELLYQDPGLDDSFLPHDFDQECDNPFISEMKARFSALSEDGKEEPVIESWPLWRSPSYEMGRSEALAFCDGDEELADAIVRGTFRISAIPKNLHKSDAFDERNAWMREQVSRHSERVAAFFADLDIKLDI